MLKTAHRFTAIMLLAVLFYSCSGDSSTESSTQTLTFSGTTRATGQNSCAGDSHTFQAGQGTISVTLVQTTLNTSLVLQVCANGIDDNNCTINQTRIAVGQTSTGAKKGVASQTLVLQPLNCGGGGPAPTLPINYTVSVTFQRP